MKIPRVELGRIGKCIYCGTTGVPLHSEHVVPLGLNGPWELLEASCEKCAAITSAFEYDVLRGPLMVTRAALGLPTRRKNLRPRKFPLAVTREGREEIIEVPLDEHLAALMMPKLELPAHLDGRPYRGGVDVNGTVCVQVSGPSIEELSKMHGTKTISVTVAWKGNTFERMLAKIGFGFAVARFGLSNLSEIYVIPAILGQKDDVGRWVGCPKDMHMEVGKFFHKIDISEINKEIVARIKLFAIFPVPEYLVVVGRLR
jgi:hypothetical protein